MKKTSLMQKMHSHDFRNGHSIKSAGSGLLDYRQLL